MAVDLPPAFCEAVLRRLPPDRFPELADLDKRPLRISREPPTSGAGADPLDHDLLLSLEAKPWLLLGEPGSGKSTLASDLVRRRADCEWAIFVPMASYDPSIGLLGEVAAGVCELGLVERAAESGELHLVLDALDEVPTVDPDALFEAVLREAQDLVDKGNSVLLTCRITDVPAWAHRQVSEAWMLPVEEEEVGRLFESVRVQDGRSRFERNPLDDAERELQGLCRNPLLLMMTLSLYRQDGLNALQQIQSRAQLHKLFFDELIHRELEKRTPTDEERSVSPALREALLATVGWRLHRSGRVFAREAEVEAWIAEARAAGDYDHFDRHGGLPTSEVLFSQAVGAPPMTARSRGRAGLEFGFLHQTFGDFFASIRVLSQRDVQVERALLIAETGQRAWPVLTSVCGLDEDPAEMVRTVVAIASESRRQDLFLLAAECIRNRWDLDADEADDLCMRILEAFKYWDAFDYRLIHALEAIQTRTGIAFPRRLRRDCSRFVTKYARTVPAQLPNASLQRLIDGLSTGPDDLSVDCAFTLGSWNFESATDRRRAVEALAERASTASPELHEQIVAALKEIASPDSRSFLESVCESDSAPARSRAFALNGLGNIGDLRSVPVVIAYLRDHENRYRDSASWSLQMLAKSVREKSPSTLATITAQYAEALRSETNDVEGVFAKGNIMYSLGELGAREYLDDVISCVESTDDPYAIEDGVNAVGELGGPERSDWIAGYLTHDDPIVRMKAAEALVAVAGPNALTQVAQLKNDRTPLVREAARRLLAANLHSTEIEEAERIRAKLVQVLSQPVISGGQATVVLDDEILAAKLGSLGEDLYQSGVAKSRPRVEERNGRWAVVMRQQSFTELVAFLGRPR